MGDSDGASPHGDCPAEQSTGAEETSGVPSPSGRRAVPDASQFVGYKSGANGGTAIGRRVSKGLVEGYYDPAIRSKHISRGFIAAIIVVIAIAAILLLVVVGTFATSNAGRALSMNITPSTETREPLPQNPAAETLYYIDNDDKHIEYSGVINEGLRYFYEKTGIWPFAWFCNVAPLNSREACDEQAAEEYDNFIDGENGLFLVYSHVISSSHWGYCMGDDVKSVMDPEAIEIFEDYVDYYIDEYDDGKISYEEAFSRIFTDTADRIMTPTTPPIAVIVTCIVIVVAAAVIVVVLAVMRRRRIRAVMREGQAAPVPAAAAASTGDAADEGDATSTSRAQRSGPDEPGAG